MQKMITLYRPVGEAEMELIRQSGFRKFPPRLKWQPIFYPVLNQAYATQIAREWNTEDAFSGYAGYVTKFDVDADFINRYNIQNVGADMHNELWIPAEDMELLNRNMTGIIEIIDSFYGRLYKGVDMKPRFLE